MQFDEAYYLAQYPDVANAVKQGNFRSGLDHYRTVGQKEGRIAGRNPAQPAIADGKSLEDLLTVAVKRRFEPLLQKYLSDNSAAVIDSMTPHFRELMDENFPALLDNAVRAELERAIMDGKTPR